MHLGHANNQQHCKRSIFDLQQHMSGSKILKQTKFRLINVGECLNNFILLISCLSLHLSELIHDPEHA